MSRWIRDSNEYERGSKWFAHWHRQQPDDSAKMIDLDGVGYCHICMFPIYLVEATKSKTRKTAIVTENLGKLAGLEVLIFYLDPNRNGEFLIDWRSSGLKPQWRTESEAWELLMSFRRTHICQQNLQGV